MYVTLSIRSIAQIIAHEKAENLDNNDRKCRKSHLEDLNYQYLRGDGMSLVGDRLPSAGGSPHWAGYHAQSRDNWNANSVR